MIGANGRRFSKLVALLGSALVLSTGLVVLASAKAAMAAQSSKLVVIPFENQSYDDIVGSSQAPYLNQLISQGTIFTGYTAVASGSNPNYLAMTSGLTTSQSPPSPNVFQAIDASGSLRWKSYMESMSGTCATASTGNVPGSTDPLYTADHDPAYYYRGNETCTANDVPLTSSSLSAANLPSFTYLVPNECDDMHTAVPSGQSCPAFFGQNSGSSQVNMGDNWLSAVVPSLLAQSNVTVVITWDEARTTTTPWEHVVTLEVGAGVTAGGIDSNAYTHYSLEAGLYRYLGLGTAPNNGGTALALPIPAAGAPPYSGPPNPVTQENSKPGTTGWKLSQEADAINQQIEGYASATSVNLGQQITLYVSVNPSQSYTLDFYRFGYYQGLGGRLILEVPNLAGVAQPSCPVESTTGMIACNWAPSYQLTVPTSWVSGFYVVKLTNAAGYQNWIIFVVRDDARNARLLYQAAFNTYEAYNNWPDDVANPANQVPATGKSLYDYNSSTKLTSVGTQRATQVSFDRPFAFDNNGAFFDYEANVVAWLEQQGYDVSYSSDVDTDLSGGNLLNHHGFISAGHDEYWSMAMFNAASNARDSGVNLAFLGADDVSWQVRFAASASGAPDRIEICYKSATLDPVKNNTTTVHFRDPQVNLPEQLLVGGTSTAEQQGASSAVPVAYVVQNASNWVYTNTGAFNGENVPNVVGYEIDSYVSTYPSPTAAAGTYQLLSNSPMVNTNGATVYQNSTIYQAGSGAWVFSGAAIEWGWALFDFGFNTGGQSHANYAQPFIGIMTANVLNKFSAGTSPLPAAPTNLTAVPSASAVNLSWTSNDGTASYQLDRSSDPAFGTFTSVSFAPATTSYNDSGLSAGVYYYRLVAVNANGKSPYVSVSAATISYAAIVAARSGLLAHWRLGETSGTTAYDTTGTYNGTYLNAPTLGSPGAIANDPSTSVTLNGTTQRASVPAVPSAGDFSIEGWTNLNNAAINNNTLYGGGGTARLMPRPGTGSYLMAAYAGVTLNGTEYVLQPTSPASNINVWVYWVLTRQGSLLTLYRNGVQIAQRSDLPATATASIVGYLGAQNNGAYYLSGRLQDVALYTQALSSTDVRNGYAAALNGIAPTPAVLPPVAPTNFAAVPSASAVRLSWTDSDPTSSYVLLRSTDPNFGSGVTINLPPGTSGYNDTGLGQAVFYYKLVASNSAGQSPSVLASASTTSYTALVASRPSLVGHWRLGEPSGTTAWDTTGANNGFYLNSPTLGSPGAIANDPNTSVTFNGVSQRVNLPALPNTQDFTVEGWTYLTNSSVNNNTLYGSSTLQLLARPGTGSYTTAAYGSVTLNGTAYALQPTSPASNINTWVYYVLTRQGATLTLYRNGVQIAQRTDLPATATINLGGYIANESNGNYYLTGRAQDVAVYNTALSSTDVTNSYTAALNGVAPGATPPTSTPYYNAVRSEPSLIGYWRLDDSLGTTARDATGRYNGTYVNGVTRTSTGAVVNDPDTSASFNGSTQLVTLPSLPSAGDFTIEGWCYLTNANVNNSTLYGGASTVQLLPRPGNATYPTAAYAGVTLNGTAYVLQPNSPASDINTWVHFVLTRQGSTLTLYRNAVQIGQRTDLPATAAANISGYIGDEIGGLYYLAGGIDEVAVYSSALTPQDITSHYQAAELGPAPAPALVSIAVSPANPAIAKGATQQFTATGTYADGSTQNLTNSVTWTSSNPSVATITSGGLATGAAQGTSQISATSGGVTGSTTLTVGPAVLVSIGVSPANPTIANGTTQQFAATGTYSDGSTQNLTNSVAWYSSNPSVATITSGGLTTGVAQGTSQISAAVGAVTGSTTLTVGPPVLVSIAVTPANPSIANGTTQQFSASGTYSDGSTADVTSSATWVSSNPAVATITAGGLASGATQGTSQISATSGGVTGSATLTVGAAVLVSIGVSPANPTIANGTTQQFAATGTYSDGSTQNLTNSVAWYSSNPSVATITSGGLTTGVAQGTSQISAAVGAVTGSTTLTVGPPVLVSIAVTPANPSIANGTTQQFSASGTYSDGSTADVTSSATWVSSNPAVATITAGGLASGATQGTSQISATSGGVTGSATLTVGPAVLVSIGVSPANPTIANGTTQQFAATGTYSDGSTQNLTNSAGWSSSNPSVATITSGGLTTGVAQGTSQISAAVGGVTGSTTLTVGPPVLVSIAVTPANPSIANGTTQQFSASGTYSDGSTADVTSSATWVSSNPAVATITAGGLASGATQGTSQISATSGGVTGSATLTVGAAVLVSIGVTPANPTIANGTTQQFTATGTYSDGSTQNLTNSAGWYSSNPSVATITSGGLATGVALGTSQITAAAGAVTGSTTLTVASSVLLSIAVTPANPTIANGTTQQFSASGTYSDGSTADVTSSATWVSSNPAVATITAGGLASGAAQGTSQISATSGGVTGSTTVTVGPPTLVSIAVTPANPTIAQGTTQRFTATGTYSDGSTADVTSSATWVSSNAGVATITAGGLASGAGQGTSQISATLGGVTGSTSLTIGPVALVSIAVTPANPTIAQGTTQQFTASGTYSDGSMLDVTSSATWVSSNAGVATITAGGLASGAAQGTSQISATLGGVTGSTSLTIGPVALVSIAVNPANPSIANGTTQQFTATGTYSDGSTADVTSSATWVSSNPAVATITAGGLASGAGQGTSQVSATSGGVTGSTTLTVGPPTLVSIAVSPASPSIASGSSQQFTATGTYSDGTTLDVTSSATWASSNTAVATVTATGLATGVTQGTSQISATSGAMTGSTTLTVGSAALVSIAVTPANPTIAKGTTQQFTATGTYSDGSTQDLTSSATWVSSNTAVATVTATGLATGVTQGTSQISATSGAMTGSTTLTVGSAALVSIAVSPASPSIASGSSQQFTATGTYSDGTTLDVTSSATWVSSNTAAATITAGGLATGVAQGTAQISASVGAVTGSTTLTVGPAVLVSIAVTPANPTIGKGTTQQFAATGTYSDGSTLDLTNSAGWVSSNTAVATVTATGLATGVTQGTSQISATSGAMTGSTTLTVGSAALVSIAVSPASPSIASGSSQQFTATGTYSDGTTLDVTSSATWVSSNTAAATITAGGLATGVAQGTSQISASSAGVTGSTTLTVGPAMLVSIAVTPANPTIGKGTTQQFAATGTYSDGSTQNLTSSVTWASSNTATATITAGGLATGVAQGTSQIGATSGAVTGSTTLTVGPAALVSIAVTPANPSIAQGKMQQFSATGTYSDGTLLDVTSSSTWVSSNTAVATITAGGLATGAVQGTSQISASVGAVTGSTTLTVGPTVLRSIAVTPANPSIAKGTTQQFTATGTYSDGSTQNLTSSVTWASSNTATATITAAGLATGTGQGTSQISASWVGVTGTTTLTVGPANLLSLAVTPVNPSIAKGATKQFIATGAYSDGSTSNLTNSVTWTSSNSGVATIAAGGIATAVAKGTSTISASSAGVTGKTTLTVGVAALVSIAVTPANPSIAKGSTQQFSATGTYSDGTTKNLTTSVTWASSKTTVATITAGGLATGVGLSTSEITATTTSVTGSTTLTVGTATLVSIAVAPANPSIAKGTTQQFTATGTYSDGSTQNLTYSATWVSSSTAVATITAGGVATGVAQGTSQISASSAGMTASTTLTVGPAVLVSIAVTPVNPSIAKGSTKQFNATGTYSDGSTLDLTSSATWVSSNSGVATVTALGLATGAAQGTSQISASAAGVTGSTTLTVGAAKLVSITVTPASQSVKVGTTVQYTATGTYSDGSTQDLTASVKWASSSPSVATITSAGTTTTLKVGSTTISATSGSIVGSTSLNVTN